MNLYIKIYAATRHRPAEAASTLVLAAALDFVWILSSMIAALPYTRLLLG